MDLDTIWTAVYGIEPIIGLVASCITCGLFGLLLFQWWRTRQRRNTSKASADSVQMVPQLQPDKIASQMEDTKPDSNSDLIARLKSAKSIPYAGERGRGLRIVAEIAIQQGNYELAIKAGIATPYDTHKSDTLAFVATSAARAGLFEVADRAASHIPYDSVQSDVKNKILRML